MTRAALQDRPVVSDLEAEGRWSGMGWSVVAAVGCAFVAAWLAAGSTGLLGHSLRHALTWVFAGAACVAAWPVEGMGLRRGVGLVGVVAMGVVLTPLIWPAANVTGVLVVFALVVYFGGDGSGGAGRALSAAVFAMGVFVVYRVALGAIPSVWIFSDRVAQLLGWVAGGLTGQKLAVGPTFGGVDFLVLTGAFYLSWVLGSSSPRGRREVFGAMGILVAHFAYLAILSFVPKFLNDVPVASRETPNPMWAVPVPGFLDSSLKLDAVAIRQFVPNNLPLVAGLFHLIVVGLMLRWGNWEVVHRRDAEDADKLEGVKNRREIPPSRAPLGLFALVSAVIVAVVLPMVLTYCSPADSLAGKKIVVSDKLYGNFLKPQNGDYGHLSIGMYGDIQPFVESLGGTAVISSSVSDDELKDADALVLIYPNKPFTDEPIDRVLRMVDRYVGWSVSGMAQQAQIDRIWKYVERGGTLLVMGEHTIEDDAVPRSTRSYLNQILAPSAIRVNFDSAMFEVGGWLQSYQAISHPITAGIEDSRNQFGVVIGASLDVKFPARPVLVGRWGWADPGDEGNGASMMGNHKYDPGERLGDMVLIAEQSYGSGRVVAFGDPSNVTNGITIGAHPFNGRLYSYLAHNPATDEHGFGSTPQTGGRQALGILLAGLLVVLLAKNPQPLAVGGVMLAMTGSLWFWNAEVATRAEIVPDGRKIRTQKIYKERGTTQDSYSGLAYIDNAHLGFYSEESWRPEGTMGLAMNLMRNGYLTLMAPDIKKSRLDGASLLVMPAPTKALTASERAELKAWVQEGGTLIMTVGWDRYNLNRQLLADFDFYEEKIPLSDFPPEVIEAVRNAKPGYEILQGAGEQRDGYGYYVFDVRKGNETLELLVHPKAGSPDMKGSKEVLAETKHTPETYQQALIKRGDIPPAPMGFFKVPYIDFGTYTCYVRFHSGWPIRCSDPMASVIAFNPGSGVALPLILRRSEGKGKVFLIGDTEFATNQNLENEGGQPFEGMRENADFWRWFISYHVKDGREKGDWWRPPNPAPAAEKKSGDGFDLGGK